MERIPEPELMIDLNQCIEYDNSISMDSINEYIDLYSEIVGVSEGLVIDLGSGSCKFVIELCKKYPNLEVICYENSITMFELAKNNIEKNKLSTKIKLVKDNIFNATGKYDVVLANRVLHHINDTESFWKLVARLSNKLLVVDINRPPEETIKNVADSTINEVYKLDLINSMKAAYSFDEVKEQIKNYDYILTADSARKLIVHHNR